jgi:hypothetical protein
MASLHITPTWETRVQDLPFCRLRFNPPILGFLCLTMHALPFGNIVPSKFLELYTIMCQETIALV